MGDSWCMLLTGSQILRTNSRRSVDFLSWVHLKSMCVGAVVPPVFLPSLCVCVCVHVCACFCACRVECFSASARKSPDKPLRFCCSFPTDAFASAHRSRCSGLSDRRPDLVATRAAPSAPSALQLARTGSGGRPREE